MNKEFENLLNQIEDEIFGIHSKYGFIVRGIEFQEEAIKKLEELINRVKELKESYIQQENEPCANSLFTYELYIESIIYEISMLINIKKDNPTIAWEDLVKTQASIDAALRIGFRSEDILKNHRRKLHHLEKLLFPPQMFTSMGFIVEESRCSLCEDDYESCEHIGGMAYMGRMCVEIIEKSKLKEISIVENPADKMCRVLSFEENGKKIDAFTLREVRHKEE